MGWAIIKLWLVACKSFTSVALVNFKPSLQIVLFDFPKVAKLFQRNAMIDGKNGIMNKMKYLQKIIFICENTLNFINFFILNKKRFENKRQKSNAL